MKCALPGRYGKKVFMESSAILDSYYETDIDGKKILAEDIGLNIEEAAKKYNEYRDQIQKEIQRDTRSEKEKSIEAINNYNDLVKEILKKDSEEHSQNLQCL